MWENASAKETQQLYPIRQKKARPAAAHDSLLLVQCLLCAVAVLLVVFVRLVSPFSAEVVHEDCRRMLEEGIVFDSDTEFVRFVNGGVQAVRERTAAWVETFAPQENTSAFEIGADVSAVRQNAASENIAAPQTAAASVQKGATARASCPKSVLAKAEVPEGASVKGYALPETLIQPAWGVLSAGYGFRSSPFTGKQEFHMGIDIAAEQGAPVYCALDGQVVEAGWQSERGYYLIVHHRAGLETLYQHLSCSLARAGELVAAGQTIAAVGDTGLTTGPHLHFELMVDGLRVDPLPQFPELEKTA